MNHWDCLKPFYQPIVLQVLTEGPVPQCVRALTAHYKDCLLILASDWSRQIT